MVKHYKRAALVAAMALASSGAMAQGLDSAESKLYANYVTDDMLLNADKASSSSPIALPKDAAAIPWSR